MPIGKNLNCVKKAEINVLKVNTSMSNRKIANIVNRSESVARKYLKDPVKYGQRYSPGRPSKITKRQKQLLIRSACNSTKSSRVLCEETWLDITHRRVHQVLNQSAIVKTAKMVLKPRLSQKNIQERFRT